jgi:hypothetical protein
MVVLLLQERIRAKSNTNNNRGFISEKFIHYLLRKHQEEIDPGSQGT